MATSSQGRLLKWLVQLAVLCTLRLLVSCTVAPMTSESFKFTKELYNAAIYENALGKTWVTAGDRMGIYNADPNLIISYNITKQSSENIFKAWEFIKPEFAFLLVRTNTQTLGALNREQRSRHRLQIEGVGKYKTGALFKTTTDLIVTVLDKNDNSPLFPPAPYNVSIAEDRPVHSVVTEISASDADEGVNGEIYYSLIQKTQVFAIHPRSGVVFLTRPLNYSVQHSYKFDILAVDRGLEIQENSYGRRRSSETKLFINVQEVNRYAPEIKVRNLPSVVEDNIPRTVYAILTVTDSDSGINGVIDTVLIVEGNPGDFSIDSDKANNEFRIVVKKPLDRELTPLGYNLTILATDKGMPRQNTTKIVHVRVIDTNDNTPVFSKTLFSAEVNESAPINTPVTFVTAADKDIGKNAEVKYHISNGNDLRLFQIVPENGLIRTAGKLDAETLEFVTLQVDAVDQANNAAKRIGSTSVKIHILDCNDNTPVFKVNPNMTLSKDGSTAVSIMENVPIGTVVFNVEAHDADKTENAYVSYTINNVNKVPFAIADFTSVVMTTELIDYETMRKSYELKIRASDWGKPFRREVEMTLKVKITDVNDNTPIFEGSNCAGYLSRDAPIDTSLLTLSAINFDESDIITYNIASGNDNDCYQLNPETGHLTVNCKLSEQLVNSHQLTVTATDGIYTAEAVTISINLVKSETAHHLNYFPKGAENSNIVCQPTNATAMLNEIMKLSNKNNNVKDILERLPESEVYNEHKPVFSNLLQNPIILKVSENVAMGTRLATLEATDGDFGYNGMVMYTILSGDDKGSLKMTDDGGLVVLSQLDRETIPRYNLVIAASDLGEPSFVTLLNVSIELFDENDCKPEFAEIRYRQTVPEDVRVNSTILRVVAEDHDIGVNARITYSLLSGKDTFVIGLESGVIIVKKPLDREEQAVYQLLVVAKDGNRTASLSATATVIVTLQDVNDNVPRFVPEMYSVKVREDLPVGAVIVTVTAHDPDLGSGGLVSYRLTSGVDGMFEIDEMTGVIRISRSLDFETEQVYNISAQAEDGGGHVSSCFINVEIIDVNENIHPPKFINFFDEGLVYENQPVGTAVLQVIAVDADDDGRGSQILYSIRDGTGLGRFSIDNNGSIRTTQVLDKETASFYWLTVYAQDRGLVPLHTRLEVLITVQDVNDNIPLFEKPMYSVSIREGSSAGIEVARVKAFDLDDPDSKSHLTYEITGGNPASFFTIDSVTGVISKTKRKLDRESQAEHTLEVTVSDKGEPQHSSTTQVIVTVDDDNDNAPVFWAKSYNANVLAREDIGPVFRVIAHDADEGSNAAILYSMKNSKKHFDIDKLSGVISNKRRLTARTKPFILKVKASDGTHSTKWTEVKLRVLPRLLMSSNPPRFTNSPVSKVVVGGTWGKGHERDMGTFVVQLECEDLDGDRLWYAITDGNAGNKFHMNPDNGFLLLVQSLNWEARNQYNLTVSVTDGVHTAYSWVFIKVADVNDHRPEFSQQVYIAEVSEKAAVGVDILTVTATDLDESNQLLYSILNTGNLASTDKFSIEADTGLIFVNSELDREVLPQHELTVMVRDRGAFPKRSMARVKITVIDHNDHNPEFLSKTFEGRVFDTAAVGTAVVQVMAIDQDKGDNAELYYSIVSGNFGNSFQIDEVLGTISVAKELDRLRQSECSLVVKATDRGMPPRSNTARVSIFITASSNSPPKFEQKEYMTEIRENSPVGSHVSVVLAESSTSVMYEITAGNDDGTFDMIRSSGVLFARQPIDYERYQFFNLTIKGTNMVGSEAFCFVLVHILDENDNRPMFQKETYAGKISEAATIGSIVFDDDNRPLVVKAEDDDADENCLLLYEISDIKAKKHFAIDSSTGSLRLMSVLDREDVDHYEFDVHVTDYGNPRLSALRPARVHIEVTDVNDSPPEFSHKIYNASVLLPTYKEVTIINVKAIDPDLTTEGELVYSLLSGDQEKNFDIDSNQGTIFVINEMNILKSYNLTVTVTDGKFQSLCYVVITVKQSRDSGMTFSRNVYFAEIMENYTVVETVTVIHVLGYSLNEHLAFRILNCNDMFVIGRTSGVIRTRGKPFDREHRSLYSLVVEVEDSRARIARVVVNVTILDRNDNAPIFVNQPYYCVVAVDSAVGDNIKQVSAIDRDSGRNGDVEYYIVEDATGHFLLDPKTGKIVVGKQLQKEDENREFHLLLEARDNGDPAMHTRITVPIRVITKATPLFDRQFYQVSIPEDVRMHSPVISLQAASPNNRKLIYSISKGDTFGEFAIDFNTDMDVLGPCVVSVVDRLDYEVTKKYELTLRATDIISGSYAEIIVAVEIEDVNDKVPSFDSLKYTAAISESALIGSPVISVKASDQDHGYNGQVVYNLAPVNGVSHDAKYFKIDHESGVISTRLNLDHEMQTDFTFNAIAMDKGFPALSTSVLVHVIVEDLNDNVPYFTQPSYDCMITDQVKRGQFVTMVSALDPDSSNADMLLYSIVGGNDKQTFTVDKESGQVQVSEHRKPALQSKYVLNVSVSDGVFTSYARLGINVRSMNYHSPKFERPRYYVDFWENVGVDTSVVTVHATDDDPEKYNMSYKIPSEELNKLFRIDADTGEILSRQILNRELQPLYEIPVAAVDSGGRTGYSRVLVTIKDKNDNVPQFHAQNYKANVYYNAAIDTSIMQVQAVDDDVDQNGAIIYSIYGENSNASRLFDVDMTKGYVTVKAPLSKESVNRVYQFFIRATDLGAPELKANVPVEILVLGAEDHAPRFTRPKISLPISENAALGSTLTTVGIKYTEPVVYKIISGYTEGSNNPETFSIDNNGNIVLLRELDWERTGSYLLSVRAETTTSPPLVDNMQIHVHIIDINDNSPQFDSKHYSTTVCENTEVGSQLIQVRAQDKDSGTNGQVQYRLTETSDTFAVDLDSGWITLLAALDRETKEAYNVSISATDLGQPKRLSNITIVKFVITDHNDEAPKFERPLYSAKVNEDALPGTVVIAVSASDNDVGTNSEIVYQIIDGNPSGQFQIQTTGEVYVNRPLDREMRKYYRLTVSASDGGFVSTTVISVDILDINDNSPICKQPLYQEIISEGIPIKSVILRVRASDADEGPNSRIKYSLEGRGIEKFTIDRFTGHLSTTDHLDREETSEFQLTARAMDEGGLSCTTEIYISLSDVNDNAPEFSTPRRTLSMQESDEINTLLTRVSASDADLGINRKVRYRLEGAGRESFRIDSESGIISLTKKLDRETTPTIEFDVVAYDMGTPRQSSQMELLVILLDVNDNPPEFERTIYNRALMENVAVNSRVLTVLATSKDSGLNAEITYSLLAGNEAGKFTINSKSGAISIVSALDYEESREYYLTVQGMDGGTPPLSGSTIVTFNITDVNDNRPIFGQISYDTTIREDADVGTQLIHVMATDADSAANSKLEYSIMNHGSKAFFRIDKLTGNITIRSPLDRETISSHMLVVKAEDSGHPPLSSTVTVTVTVSDANDCPPMFSEKNYTKFVPEHQSGFSIHQFVVRDFDMEPNGAPFVFDVISGNDEFRVNGEGMLVTTSSLDHQLKDLYTLTVRVFDNGDPPLFSDSNVTIHVIEESTFPPEVTDLEIAINSYHDRFSGGLIGTVKATDADIHDILTYEMVSANEHLFKIDENTGQLFADQGLDAGNYVVNVSVSDGKYLSYGTVDITISAIMDDMLTNAVTIQFENLEPEDFYSNHLVPFQNMVKREFSVPARNVVILNVQRSSESLSEKMQRRKREASSKLDVLFAVRKQGDKFYPGQKVKRKVLQMSRGQNSLNVTILTVFNDICEDNMCKEGICQSSVKFDNNPPVMLILDGQSYVSSKHKYVYECNCREGSGGTKCRDCHNSPCTYPEVCLPHPTSGYECVCPEGRSGSHCTVIDNSRCAGSFCQRGDKPMTFSGRSFVRWKLRELIDERLSVSLQIKTRQSTAMLMYARGQVDYSILEIENGLVKYRFECGSGEGLVIIPMYISDGRWHRIVVDRRGKRAEILLDDKYTAQATAPGTNDVLNLHDKYVYFGAQVNLGPNNQRDVINGFDGCMKDIKIYNIHLPINGSNSVATEQSFEKVEFYCRDSTNMFHNSNPCSSFPCQNHGSCISTGARSYLCQCGPRFEGKNCEIDSNPCADDPCLNGGSCMNIPGIPNEYECDCARDFSGRRCNYGHYCIPNPCLNGGTCIEGPLSAVCHCIITRFEGSRCETELNNCMNTICGNGEVCKGPNGSYVCNCTNGDCKIIVVPQVTPTNKNTFIYIGVAVGVILILAAIMVAVLVCRRRRRERRNNGIGYIKGKDDYFNEKRYKSSSGDLTLRSLNNSSPSLRPPPVPNRPASYTPSNHDSAANLNAFDHFNNYGSAADDLESVGIHNVPPYSPPDYMQTFGPPVQRSGASIAPSLPTLSASNSESSIQKSGFEHSAPNIYENERSAAASPRDKIITVPVGSPAIARMALAGRTALEGRSLNSMPALSEDELQAAGLGNIKAYYWDNSDMQQQISPVSEVSVLPISNTPSSSPHSNGSPSGIRVHPLDDDNNYFSTDDVGNESEYVEDSEYPDEEYAGDPGFTDKLHQRLNMHPNEYLPQFNLSSFHPELGLSTDLSDPDVSEEDEEAINPYGFPPPGKRNFPEIDIYASDSEINDDYAPCGTSFRDDDMSTSMDFNTSISVCSGESNHVCDIEDSEVNNSEDSDEDDNDSARLALMTHYNTHV